MKLVQKLFYETFDILKNYLEVHADVTSKEKLYTCILFDVYDYVDIFLADDGIRKITSGQELIHLHARKRLHTYEGFESFRRNLEQILVVNENTKEELLEPLIAVANKEKLLPKQLFVDLSESICDENKYTISRYVAAILVASEYSDYLAKSNKKIVLDYKFMRLTEEEELLEFPSYLTEMQKASAESFVGRNEEKCWLHKQLIETDKSNHVFVSAVGGLGKTELVKSFLEEISATPIDVCGIEKVAWVSYDNIDILESIKNAFHMTCDIENVWMNLQSICEKHGNRMLLIVDNIEKNDDDYIRKLDNLPCNILVTTRLREVPGFKKSLELQPLSMDECRELFYFHYQFEEHNNELVVDIIDLTAKLTIMIVFIAKAAYLEGISLQELYDNLVYKGFKLSEEDVSCEHEKLAEEDTIINQMCILFSLMKYEEDDKTVLTDISIIPALQFDFEKAKKWFGVSKNSMLLKLYKMGMLEHRTQERKHIYWMHSVIAAAVREQQKDKLYELSRPFVKIMTEELDIENINDGTEYQKAYLIPFSWSIMDIMESMWATEDDIEFLLNLFSVSYVCSNFRLCEKIIELVISIENKFFDVFGYNQLLYAYSEKIDLLLQMNRISEAEELFKTIQKVYDEKLMEGDMKEHFACQLAGYYEIIGDYGKAEEYNIYIVRSAEEEYAETGSYKNLSRAYDRLGELYLLSGELFKSEEYLKKALELYKDNPNDSYAMVIYGHLAATLSKLMNAGYGTSYYDETVDCYEKVIEYREKHLGLHHVDTGVIYLEYASFWCDLAADEEGRKKAIDYMERAKSIYKELFGEHHITSLQIKNLEGLILWDSGKLTDSAKIFESIIEEVTQMGAEYDVEKADYLLNYAYQLLQVAQDDFSNAIEDVEYNADDFMYSREESYEKAKMLYVELIELLRKISTTENPKLAAACQEYGELLMAEGDFENAVELFIEAKDNVTDDFYTFVDLLDSIGACHIVLGNVEEGVAWFDVLIEQLLDGKANDDETKYDLCSNLACLLDPEDDSEVECRTMLMERIKNDETKMEYVKNYF